EAPPRQMSASSSCGRSIAGRATANARRPRRRLLSAKTTMSADGSGKAQESPPNIWWEGPVLKRSGLFHALRFLFGTIPGGPRCRLVRGHANHPPRPSPAALERLTPVTDLPRLRAPFGGQSAFRAVSAKRGRPGLKNGGDQRDQENNYENKEENAGYS